MRNENSFPLDWLCENTAVAINRNYYSGLPLLTEGSWGVKLNVGIVLIGDELGTARAQCEWEARMVDKNERRINLNFKGSARIGIFAANNQ